MSRVYTATDFRKLIEDEGKIAACKIFRPQIESIQQAEVFIWQYIQAQLKKRKYASAALVLWGDSLFDPRPQCVGRVFRALHNHPKVMVMGGSSLGKSYTCIGWTALDWLADMQHTSFKIISTTAGHAKGNTFSTLVNLHKMACIPLPGFPIAGYLGLDSKERKSGIEVVGIPTGDDGKGRLQGFHPDPRQTPDPDFGTHGRVRALLDECEEIPLGVWDGVGNMLGSQHGADTIKVAGAFNPKDPTTKTAQICEPIGGWENFDVETGVGGRDEWTSKEGWHVVRLDPAKTENVRERKVIYTGFQTYEGYKDFETKNGGNSPEYYAFGRGCYPPNGVSNAIISGSILQGARGEFVFMGIPILSAGVDTAVDGRDNCVMTIAKVGLATGFRKKTGELTRFESPRVCIQLDQQFELKKGDVKIVGDDIIRNCKAYGISPEYVGIDSTGNGAAVWAYICAQWATILGVDFNKAASRVKILSEDKRTPDELYDGVVTEVWYAMRFLMEFGYLSLAPGIRQDPLEPELLGRRYVIGQGKLLKVEKKDDYKKRISKSPDFADSATIVVHVCRMREALFASMQHKPKPTPDQRAARKGIVERVTWLK